MIWAVYTTYCKYNKKSLQLLDRIVKSMLTKVKYLKHTLGRNTKTNLV